MGSSVASFLVWGGGGGQAPKIYRQKKKSNLYARASEASDRLKNIHFQVAKYICIHTINAVPFYYLWHGAIYDSIMIKHYSLRKIYEHASERSERA